MTRLINYTIAVLGLSLATNCFINVRVATSLVLNKAGTGRNNHPVFAKIGLSSRSTAWFDGSNISPVDRRTGATKLNAGFIVPITKAATSVSPGLRNAIWRQILGLNLDKSEITIEDYDINRKRNRAENEELINIEPEAQFLLPIKNPG